jgi:hypothetical protein
MIHEREAGGRMQIQEGRARRYCSKRERHVLCCYSEREGPAPCYCSERERHALCCYSEREGPTPCCCSKRDVLAAVLLLG